MWKHADYYPLSEAYWKTGCALYHESWNGYELQYRPNKELVELRNAKRKAEQDYERIAEQIRRRSNLPIRNMTEHEYRIEQSEFKALEQMQRDARQERDRLIDVLKVPEKNDAAYQRRVAAECRLAEAFSKEELRLLFNQGRVVEWNKWSKLKSFKVSFGLSLIFAPSSESSLRRGGAYVLKVEFDEWIETILTLEIKLSKTEGAEEFQAMRNWFKEWILCNPERKTFNETQAAFSPVFKTKAKLTYKNLWKLMAPKDWKEKGRIKANQ